MNTCKNCRWWDFERYNVGEGICDRPDRLTTKNAEFRIHASADDDSNLCAYLITGPDFGCIHFEQKGKP